MTSANAARYNGSMRVLILAALLPEARAIARAFHWPRRFPGRFITRENITLGLIGPRATHLESVRALQPQALIMAGLAGALAPHLAVGNVVIHGACGSISALAHQVHRGTITSSPDIVATPSQKAALFLKTGALAVDMESAAAHNLARSLSIPFLAVRAISDTAAEPLDPQFLQLVDAHGRPRIGRALGRLAIHPTSLPGLIHLRRSTQLALSHLSATLVAILASGWPAQHPSPPHRPCV